MSSQLKKVHFTVVSINRKCFICSKPLKLNLTIKKPKAKFCYRCYLRQVAIRKDMEEVERNRLHNPLQ